MTTGENTDSINESENLTVTSDTAFERVTNDFKMEEEISGGYLKQNTAGLVQEIPNISFLDISDTMLESHKTLHNRKNWNIVVGNSGKSIEAQPQDTVTLKLTSDYLVSSFPGAIHFDDGVSSLNWTVCKIDDVDTYKIDILESGYYKISYGWTINPGNATSFSIGIGTSNNYVTADKFTGGSYGTEVSGGRAISNVYLNQGDYVFMDVLANSSVTVKKDFTYLEIQFQQYTL